MKITDVKVETIRIPMKKPFRIAFAVQDHSLNVLVKISTDEGLWGIGEAAPFEPVTGESAATVLEALKLFRTGLIGMDPLDVEGIHRMMDRLLSGNTSAKAAVDIALYDIKGKLMGQPLYKVLGGSVNQIVTDMTVGIDTPEAMAAEARERVEKDGFTILKIKAGINPSEDIQALTLIRQAVGPNIRLRVDANQGYTVSDAVRTLKAFEELGVEAVEQCLPSWDLDGMRFVRSKVDLQVMLDESVHTPIDAAKACKIDAADIINIKLMKCGGLYPAEKINAIAEVLETNLPISLPRIAIGIIFGIITAIIIIGGIESIAVVCEKLVPLMALFYVVGCIVILCANYDFLLPALKAIFVLAFKPGAVTGGLVGGGIRLALQYGVARGLFSNESGMGSAPLVASAAQTRNPVRQALVSATGTFWTTVVVCLMTGLVLVSSMMKNPAVSVENMANGGQMTTAAFAQIPYIGPLILMVSIITFAYSTILGWSYYGERAAEYLLGKKAILPYKVLFIAVVVCAPVLALDLVWTIADVLNALMAIPNLIAVLLLSGVIAAETKHYLKHLDEKDESEIPVVDR